MASDQGGQNPEVWILDRGEAVPDDHDMRLRAAAVRVWPNVETFAKRELSGSSLAGETSLVWDIWEQTLQSLSHTLRRRLRLRLIRDLDSYLFGAFAHRLRKVLRKDDRICSLKQRIGGTETDSRLVLGGRVREFVAIESRSRRHGRADERSALPLGV